MFKESFNRNCDNKDLTYLKKLSKGIFKKTTLDKIKSQNDLIEIYRDYYSKQTAESLNDEKIYLSSKLEGLKERSLSSKTVNVITLAVTILIFIFSISNTEINESKTQLNAENTILENRKQEYHIRNLELESKINTCKNADKVKQMREFQESLKNEIKSIENNLSNNDNSLLEKAIPLLYKLAYALVVYVLLCFISIHHEHNYNFKVFKKKQYIKMRIDIVDIILKQQYEENNERKLLRYHIK